MKPVILLVEDNPSDEKLTLRALAKSAIPNDVVIARDGAEALDYLFGTGKYAEPARPDLPAFVLLDLKLPRVDGLEVLRRLKADDVTKIVPVVVLTASREAEDVTKGLSLGANAYVRKPVDFAHFVDAVNTLVVFWLHVNELGPRRRSVIP